MKKVKKLLLILLVIIPLVRVNASCFNSDGSGKKGSISVGASSLTVEAGNKTTFKINAPCAAGKITISSSDKNIASVSPSEEFVDDSSITVTIKGKSEGTATINVVLEDVADYARNVLTGTKKVSITVKKAPITTNNSTTTNNTETTVPKETKEMKITKFDIVGYDINFDPNILEYTIDVAENVSKLYIIVKGENFSVSGDKEVNIQDKDNIVVSFKNGNNIVEYLIKINRNTASSVVPPEIKEETKEVIKVNYTYLYTTLGLLAMCVVLITMLIKKKRNKNVNDQNIQKQITPIQTTQINTNTTFTPTIAATQSTIPNEIETLDISPKNNINNQIDNNLQ